MGSGSHCAPLGQSVPRRGGRFPAFGKSGPDLTAALAPSATWEV